MRKLTTVALCLAMVLLAVDGALAWKPVCTGDADIDEKPGVTCVPAGDAAAQRAKLEAEWRQEQFERAPLAGLATCFGTAAVAIPNCFELVAFALSVSPFPI